jgi:N-acetyl-gamma-glutamyl-phosphate reductase
VHLLKRHPRVEPILFEHRQDAPGAPIPLGYEGPRRVSFSTDAIRQEDIALVFLATPPEVSLDLAPAILGAGARCVDLSGAFRLQTAENYRRWYKEQHTQTALLAEAVYGLPEFYRGKVAGARLIANPGCYPTAASLAIQPLVAAGMVDRAAGVVCDAKSGVSGAGRKPSLKTSFCEVTENFSAYSVLEHRHVAEILMNCGLEEAEFSFTAQLLPVDRGILETIYFRLAKPADLVALYRERYASEPFVRIYPNGQVPDLRAVARTNYCDLGVVADSATGRAVVVAAIDNLVKGAAGQAVQNMNLVLGWPETEGLL